MCLIEGEDSVKAIKIFEAIEKCFEQHDTSWQNCIVVNVDNTKSKVCARNFSVSTHLDKNHQTFIGRCPYDLASITVSNANDVFGVQTGPS